MKAVALLFLSLAPVLALDFRSIAEFPATAGSSEVIDGLESGLVTDGRGNFYGVHRLNGANLKGFVFHVTPDGTLTTLHSFDGTDGQNPRAALRLARDGNLYGTTSAGGSAGQGTIFKITPAGSLTTLWHFTGNDGSDSRARLLQTSDGHFYGTTAAGGGAGEGTAFRFTSAGQFTVLRNFTFVSGSKPRAGLTVGTDGALYGTASVGGTFSYGVAYRLTPAGDYRVLHHFGGGLPNTAPLTSLGKFEGIQPCGELFHVGGGVFYGTTLGALSYGQNGNQAVLVLPIGTPPNPARGSLFRVTAKGAYAALSLFKVAGDNGGSLSGLVRGADGALYGTTTQAVFRYVIGGSRTVIHNFGTTFNAGACTLCSDDAGNLWGTNIGTETQFRVPVTLGGIYVLARGQAGAAGNYLARFHDAGDTHAASGIMQLALTATGVITGKVTLAGKSHAFSGKLDVLGEFNKTILRGAVLPPLQIQLHLNVSDAIVDRITGSVTISGNTLALDMPRTPSFRYTTPAQLERHTARLTPPATAGLPGGHGFATLLVAKTGVITIAGKLPDATPFTASSRVQADATFPLYAGLYAVTARGSVRGDFTFSDNATSDATATANWDKPQQKTGLYAAGLVATLDCAASAYTAPAPDERLLAWGDTLPNGRVTVVFGAFTRAAPFDLLFNHTAKFTPGTGGSPLLAFNRTVGLFSGSFLEGAKRLPIAGVLFQKTAQGFGQYRTTTGTQAAGLEANP